MDKQFVTLQEIKQQPDMWIDTYNLVESLREEIDNFISVDERTRVIFTGAGTSNFIGNIIAPYLNKVNDNENLEFYSIGSPTIVSNPLENLPNNPTILVNFARSGNSPESVATVQLADQLIDKVKHLYITCAKEGKLAVSALDRKDDALAIVLNDKTNDKGFAMTSSFSSMTIAALLVFDPTASKERVEKLAKLGQEALNYDAKLDEVIKEDFNRLVYLGSGPLAGLTEEAQLKILELTAGQIATLYESSVGFRHGPKSFVNDKTLVFNFISNDDYTRKYDLDIVKEVKSDEIARGVYTLGSSDLENVDFSFEDAKNMPDAYISLAYVIIGQLFAYKAAIKVENDVDNPSSSGTVNRVVQGVNIYPFEK